MRKFFSLFAMLMVLFTMSAQMPQLTPMPLDPKVKHGTLPNGLQYFILHNEEPKERANFYIAQKVGSTLETQEQLGLAHFLEHMAFNGTEHYPGKAMLDYLQAKGIRFGADINAYTDFDETVYNIDNVPTTDVALMDSVLLVLHDWSGSLLLAEDEIDAERGVIEEEWRQRNDANIRMFTAILPQIYKEYQYQQMPIGSMDVVRNFPYDALRSYYKKWYRPDQQGIVIVGDFDVDAMEKKVIDLFSPIPMPADAAERTYPVVSGNEEPIYAFFEDPELQQPIIRASIKLDKFPFEMRNSLEYYVSQDLMPTVVTAMINHRLSDYAQEADCPYAYAGTNFGNFYISKTINSFDIILIPKADPEKAFQAAVEIVARACKTGFTDSELERVISAIDSNYEKTFNERNNTRTSTLAKQIIRHYIDNEPYAGIEQEYDLFKMLKDQLPVQAYNQLAAQIIQPNNQVIVFYRPTSTEAAPDQAAMTSMINNAMGKDYEPLAEEKITEPLIAKLPKKGKIKKQTENAELGTTEFVLSNGVKVILKQTDYKADEVIFQAFAEGGKRAYNPADRAAVLMMSDAYEVSKMGPFDQKTLRKYLAGKQVGLGFSVNNVTNTLEGSSTVKDLPTLMELIYATFTEVSADQNAWNVLIDNYRLQLANADKNPEKIFSDAQAKAMHPNNSLLHNVTAKDMDDVDYTASLALLKQALSDAANFTFMFVGSVDAETLRPLLEQYIATLPVQKKHAVPAVQSDLNTARGMKDVKYDLEMEHPQVKMFDLYSGTNLEYNTFNNIAISMTGQILDMMLLETIREEMGATYGAHTFGYMSANTDPAEWSILYFFDTNIEKGYEALDRAHSEFASLINNGADPEKFAKVKEAMKKQLEIGVRTNGYWSQRLMMAVRGFDIFSDREEVINNMTVEKLNDFMKKLNLNENRIEIQMNITEKAK